jgi:hypothetical protein
MIKLYALTCFAKYPHFQLRALGHKDATLTNNSVTFKGRKGHGRNDSSKGKGRGPNPKGKGRGGRSKGKGPRSDPGKGRGWHTPTEENTTPKTKSPNRTGNKKGKGSPKPSTPFNGECSYCGIYGHQSRDCRKRIYAESKKTQRQTNNSVTATKVTFDADEDDLTGSEPEDETATLFQSVVTVESDNEEDSTDEEVTTRKIQPALPRPHQDNTMDTDTDDEEEREYYIEVIDGVRHLQYSVVVPPDGPTEPVDLAQQGNSENANEPQNKPTQPDSRWGENTTTTGLTVNTQALENEITTTTRLTVNTQALENENATTTLKPNEKKTPRAFVG